MRSNTVVIGRPMRGCDEGWDWRLSEKRSIREESARRAVGRLLGHEQRRHGEAGEVGWRVLGGGKMTCQAVREERW